MTLMEMVVIIVVIGLAIPALLTNFATISRRAVSSEAIADGTMYAEQLMEEITSKDFVDPSQTGNTALGPNGSETYPDYNDVDDYAGYTGTAGGYSLSVAVVYASLSGSTWVVSATPTDFKLITVTVSNARSRLNAALTALAAAY